LKIFLMNAKNKILITGTSGFVGFHVASYFLNKDYIVYGVDNHNNYYDIKLKIKRCNLLKKYKKFFFIKDDIQNKSFSSLLGKIKPDVIIHLAAQAGVRFSYKNPFKYIDYNITGFLNLLESMKKYKLNNLIYASSSSIYGNVKKYPIKENFEFNPENFYGLTKVFNEKLVDVYLKNYQINSVGLRMFTVYGELGRPDMFIPKIINNLKTRKFIQLYNNGNHYRDFTYVGDVSKIIFKLSNTNFLKNKKNLILNICSGKSISIIKIIKLISQSINIKPLVKKLSFQKGDMLKTHGNNKKLIFLIGKFNFTNIAKGIKKTLVFKSF